mgnify:CR=1 FL=1
MLEYDLVGLGTTVTQIDPDIFIVLYDAVIHCQRLAYFVQKLHIMVKRDQ